MFIFVRKRAIMAKKRGKKNKKRQEKPVDDSIETVTEVASDPEAHIKENGITSVETIEEDISNGNKKKSRKSRKNLFFGIIWLYLLAKLIVTDIDAIIVPNLIGISTISYITLRILVLTGIVIIIWSRIGNKRFWKNLGLFLLFPIYPLGWKIIKNGVWDFPNFAHRHKLDFLLFSYFDLVISFAVKFKTTLIKWIGFLLAVTLMLIFNNPILYLSIAIFAILEISHLYRRWSELFGPIKLFQIKLGHDVTSTPFSEDMIKKSIRKDESKSKKEQQISEMEHLILMREFMGMFDKRVQNIMSSKSYMKSFIIKAFYSIFYAMIIFGAINFCLYKIDPTQYRFTGSPIYFDFFYYSFFTIIPDGTDIEPISYTAKLVKMLGVAVGYGINILIFALYISTNSKKYQENLSKVSIWSTDSNKFIEDYLNKKYGKNPTDGYKWLRKKGSNIEENINAWKKFFRVK